MVMKNKQSQINWYQAELNKDKIKLEKNKQKIISELSGLSKDDVLPKKTKKINIWQRLKKVMMG